MIGLGVDDMYIVLNAMREQGGYTDHDFVVAMQGIIAPVTMTSLVNASMFAVMNIVDIGAIYKTAQAALISVIFLYLSIILCFPAYCYLDMKRQEAKRCDVFMCIKVQDDGRPSTERGNFLFGIYRSLFLAGNVLSMVMQGVVFIGTIAIFVVGAYGISQRKVGVGLQVRKTYDPDNSKLFHVTGCNVVGCDNIVFQLIFLNSNITFFHQSIRNSSRQITRPVVGLRLGARI